MRLQGNENAMMSYQSLPPGPPESRIAQSIEFTYRPFEFLSKCRETYGETFTLRMMNMPDMVVTANLDFTRYIFDHPKIFEASEANKKTQVDLALGDTFLMALGGEQHKKMYAKLKGILDAAIKKCKPDLRRLAINRINTWEIGGRFDLLDEVQFLALELMLFVLLGDDRTGNRGLLVSLFHKMISTSHVDGQPTMIPNAGQYMLYRQQIYDLLDEEIRTYHPVARTQTKDVLLTQLLNPSYCDPVGSLPHATIRDQLLSMTVAGYDTTATTLTWALFHTLRSPDLVYAVRQEFAGYLHDPCPERAPGKIINKIVTETERLHPITPVVNRITTEDREYGGWYLPKGTMVCPSLYLIHRNFCDSPDDFCVERKQPRLYPFGGGNRKCVGMVFATQELHYLLGLIISLTELQLIERDTFTLRRGFVLVPANGVPVIYERPLHNVAC